MEDTALFLDVAAGHCHRDRSSLPDYPGNFAADMLGGVKGMRVAYSSDLGYAPAVDPQVARAVRDAAFSFKELGCMVEEIDAVLPSPEADWIALVLSETMAAFEDRIEEWKPQAYPLYLPFLDIAGLYNNKDICRVQFHRYELWEKMLKIFLEYDILITPTTAVVAFDQDEAGPRPHGADGHQRRGGRSHRLGPLHPCPSTSPDNPPPPSPAASTPNGMPIGMQIVGNLLEEATVLRAARAYEAAHPWAPSMGSGATMVDSV